MKRFFLFILFLLGIIIVNAEEIERKYNYTEWFNYYPSDVEEYRIQSEERYLWYREYTNEEGKIVRDTTSEYFKEKDGYKVVEGSSKMFYRVLHNCTVLLDSHNYLVMPESISYCMKNRCHSVTLGVYTIKHEENNNNPDTGDNIELFLTLFICSLLIIIIHFKKII